jgi:Bacterial regulatory helix-turn-helix protein, lysR family
MSRFVGLDVSQKLTSICVIDETGRRLWRGSMPIGAGADRAGGARACCRRCRPVAETGSISKAAARVGASQPTLSQRMAELENHLGLPYFIVRRRARR